VIEARLCWATCLQQTLALMFVTFSSIGAIGSSIQSRISFGLKHNLIMMVSDERPCGALHLLNMSHSVWAA
jgi:hypothetical protein